MTLVAKQKSIAACSKGRMHPLSVAGAFSREQFESCLQGWISYRKI